MVVKAYARTVAILLLVCTSIKSSHSQRTYDKGDWIPLFSSCPTCQREELSQSRKIDKKEASGRVLNVGQADIANQFVDKDKFISYNVDQNFKLGDDSNSYEGIHDYYNFNKPPNSHQGHLQGADSHLEETNKRQHLLAQKALEPLFLNQELQPPKPISVDSEEQTNNLRTSNSKEKISHSNNKFQNSNAEDNIPPLRFNLLQSNIQPNRHSLETPKLVNNQRFLEGNGNENIKNSNSQYGQFSSERQNYSSIPLTTSPSFNVANGLKDKIVNENRSSRTSQFKVQNQLNQNAGLSSTPNLIPSIIKESDIQSHEETILLQQPNRFLNGAKTTLSKSLSDINSELNFSLPQIGNIIQDVNAGLQPEVPQIDKTTPLYQQSIPSEVYPNKGSEHIETTTPTNQPNKESVDLLYIPVQYLNNNREQPKYFSALEDTTSSSFSQNQHSPILNKPTNNFHDSSHLLLPYNRQSGVLNAANNRFHDKSHSSLIQNQQSGIVKEPTSNFQDMPPSSFPENMQSGILNEPTNNFEDLPLFPQNRQSGVLGEPNNNFQKASAQPFKQVQEIEGIQNDFSSQALEAFKLQEQLNSRKQPSTFSPVNNRISSATTLVKKKKSHQPPLAVYMENNGNVKVTDVLNLLKNSRTITVQDTVGPDTPPVFVGPYDLHSPDRYAKFDLPYLSSLDANQIEANSDEFPFFVAPINYKAPGGYSKIPLPSPHVGSIVLSEKNNKGTSSRSTFVDISSKDVAEHKQHYRDTLDQPNYQTKLLTSNVGTPLSIRQTTDHNDYNQLNNHFVNSNQRIPSPQSKFEEEYNRINNIYRTTSKPEISKFIITTSTPSPVREQQQYLFNPQTGFIEQIPQTQRFMNKQRPLQGDSTLEEPRGELAYSFPSRPNIPAEDFTEHQHVLTESEEDISSTSRLPETPKHNVDISTTLRPSRGRFRETNDQISAKQTKGRGPSHYSSTSYGQGETQDLERPKSAHRGRVRNKVTSTRTKEESNQEWQKHADESSPPGPTTIGSRSTAPGGKIYNDESQTHINNINPLDKTMSNKHNTQNIPQVPYYQEISDSQPYNQQVPASLSLNDREEAKKQRIHSVSSLEQTLGIPITSNGASGILSQSPGDDVYSDHSLKSTEEPVFEFTTRSQPSKSRPSTFESYEISSTHSDESREFDDFFLTSSELEEEPKNFRLPSQAHSVNPAIPGLINNLQDQSIRSILNPALIAPTTQQSTDEITQRIKLPHADTTISNHKSFLKPQQSYQTPHSSLRLSENYEVGPRQQKQTITADNRKNPIHLESYKPEIVHSTALPTAEQQNINNLQPSGSFSLSSQGLSSPSLQSIESSTHLPTVETTTATKRGRGRYRSRGSSVSSTTTAPTRRNLHRTRRPLKVESRSESLDHHQTASSTYSPIKLSKTVPVNARYQTTDSLNRPAQFHTIAPLEKSEYYQNIQVVPEQENMPSSSPNKLERQEERSNTFNSHPALKGYAPDTTISAPNSFIPSNGEMSSLPMYRTENMNVHLSPNLPILYNKGLQIQDMSYLTSPSASAAEQTQSHSSNVQIVHPDDYRNETFINFVPRNNLQHYESTEGDHVKLERVNQGSSSPYLNYNTAPSAVAAISETAETTKGRNLERGRVRGRTSTKQIPSRVPVTEHSKAATLEKPQEENEEFYGFFRSPNFNAVTLSPTSSTSSARISRLPVTGLDFTNSPESHLNNSQSRDDFIPHSSTQQSIETVRPKYSSIIRHSTDSDKESNSAATTKQPESTQRSRKRGRTRKPYANAPSTSRTSEQTSTSYARRSTTTERPSIRTTQKLRSRGRVHFQPPQPMKEKREDDLETANYPASFLASQGIGNKQSATRSIAQTENPNFQITVESGFDANEDLTGYDQLTNPSYISASIVMPDGRTPLSNQIENVDSNTAKTMQVFTSSINSKKSEESTAMKKRGFWKLVNQKPISDPLEAEESQNVGSFSANIVKIAENKYTKDNQGKGMITDKVPRSTEEIKESTDLTNHNIDDSFPDIFGTTTEYNLNSNAESYLVSQFNSTEPDKSEVVLGASVTTESENETHKKKNMQYKVEEISKPYLSTETPTRTTNAFEKSMRTLQSTEISHETEICYRGKCIRTSNQSL